MTTINNNNVYTAQNHNNNGQQYNTYSNTNISNNNYNRGNNVNNNPQTPTVSTNAPPELPRKVGGGDAFTPSITGTSSHLTNDKTLATVQPPPSTGYERFCCWECYNPSREVLEYDYNYDDHNKPAQPYPRIRERGEYYIDSFNDQPWSWTFGTNENNGIWFNSSDQAGSIMSAMVWILMLYSALTVTLLTVTEGIPVILGMLYTVLVALALASHVKTSLTDPGSVPVQAIPSERQRLLRDSHSMCGQCQTFKPPGSHHCRICNRCISRMDHHCPWMNNCVGAGNMKHFILFLAYTWTCAAYSLILFGWNYFFCADEDCTFHPIVLHLVRVMTLLAVGAFLFTSSMLMNVCYGVMTGIGTIDRLKKKATNTMSQSDEEPIDLVDVFGVAPFYTWILPVDPVFEDYDRVMGYTMPQRLDRERQFCDAKRPVPQINSNQSLELPRCVNDLLPV